MQRYVSPRKVALRVADGWSEVKDAPTKGAQGLVLMEKAEGKPKSKPKPEPKAEPEPSDD